MLYKIFHYGGKTCSNPLDYNRFQSDTGMGIPPHPPHHQSVSKVVIVNVTISSVFSYNIYVLETTPPRSL